MKLNIIYNKSLSDYKNILNEIEEILINKGVKFKSFDLDNMGDFGELSLVIGGDGTLLKTAKFYAKTNTPVLGINIGRLGFLSQSVNTNEIIENILERNFFTEERLMLVSGDKTALNDFVIKGCNASRTSKFYLEINGECVCDYIADGLIISTPTGSTAYGLSAGGPVIYPTMEAIVIVPICPHTLNARPLVVPANEMITIKTAENLLSVSIDGFESETSVEKIFIKKSNEKALLAFLKQGNFYTVLRDKLHWGTSEAR